VRKSSSFTLLLMACGLLHGQDSLTLSSGNATAGGSVTPGKLRAGDGGGGASTTYRGEYFYDYGWRYGAYCRHDLYLGLNLSRTVSHE
jgi:hypothetical protein